MAFRTTYSFSMKNLSITEIAKEDRKWLLALSAFVFLLLFFCSKMSPLYPLNEWSDINFYFNIGKCIFNNKPLYIDSFDHKGPLIFFIYGIGYLISNSSFAGMFVILLIVWLLFMYAAYIINRLYLRKATAFVASIIATIFIFKFTEEGGSAEEFCLIFQGISMLLFIKYYKEGASLNRGCLYMLVHGILFSMVLFIKINLVVFWIFPILVILINLIFERKYKDLIYYSLAFLGGVAIIALPICIYLYLNDALSEAYNVYILLNKKYSQDNSIGNIIFNLAFRFYLSLRTDPVGFILVLIGAIYFPFRFITNKWNRTAFLLSALLMYVVIFMSPHFYAYYPLTFYVFIIPGILASFCYLKEHIHIQYTKPILIGITAVVLLVNISSKDFFGLSIQNLIGTERPKGLVEQFGEEINRDKNPTLLVIGNHLGNAVFTKYNILPNVKHFISPNISHEAYPPLGIAQTDYITNKRTKFIIIATFAFDYMYFEKLSALKDNYSLIDSITEPDGHKYLLYKAKD